MAERTATEQALAELPAIAARLGVGASVTARTRREHQEHLAAVG